MNDPKAWRRQLGHGHHLSMYHYDDRREMQFDWNFLRGRPDRPSLVTNITLADAKAICARLDEFIAAHPPRRKGKTKARRHAPSDSTNKESK